MRSLLVSGLSALLAVTFLSGCATDEPPTPAPDSGVSNIPWNRPQKWETGASLPGIPGSGGGGIGTR